MLCSVALVQKRMSEGLLPSCRAGKAYNSTKTARKLWQRFEQYSVLQVTFSAAQAQWLAFVVGGSHLLKRLGRWVQLLWYTSKLCLQGTLLLRNGRLWLHSWHTCRWLVSGIWKEEIKIAGLQCCVVKQFPPPHSTESTCIHQGILSPHQFCRYMWRYW